MCERCAVKKYVGCHAPPQRARTPNTRSAGTQLYSLGGGRPPPPPARTDQLTTGQVDRGALRCAQSGELITLPPPVHPNGSNPPTHHTRHTNDSTPNESTPPTCHTRYTGLTATGFTNFTWVDQTLPVTGSMYSKWRLLIQRTTTNTGDQGGTIFLLTPGENRWFLTLI